MPPLAGSGLAGHSSHKGSPVVSEGKKRIVFTWELGEGMGHMVPYIPLVRSLHAMGCEVVFLVRDPGRAEGLVGKEEVRCLHAPQKTPLAGKGIRVPCTYTHILHNNGFSDLEFLAGMVQKWREMYDTLKPSLVIFDHTPTGVLASAGYEFKKIHMGTGFTIPPDIYPLPNLRTWLKINPERLQREEDYILGVMNRVLARLKAPPFKSIGELFSQDPRVLMTYKELDPYGERPNETYWGTWMTPMGEDPVWPDKPGKRVFAYLKPFPALAALLALFKKLNMPTLAYIPGLDRSTKEKIGSPWLKFVDRPLNMEKVASQCDLAILNGTHYTTAQLLFAGKPTLHFPLYLEQHLTARKIEQLGVGLYVSRSEEMEARLGLMVDSDFYSGKAKAFSERYKDSGGRNQRVNRLVEAMLM